jgi:hypothetical protein
MSEIIRGSATSWIVSPWCGAISLLVRPKMLQYRIFHIQCKLMLYLELLVRGSAVSRMCWVDLISWITSAGWFPYIGQLVLDGSTVINWMTITGGVPYFRQLLPSRSSDNFFNSLDTIFYIRQFSLFKKIHPHLLLFIPVINNMKMYHFRDNSCKIS